MEIPEVNFRTQIAEELSRTELIDRLCEYHEKIKQLNEQIESDKSRYCDESFGDDDDDIDDDYDDYDDEPNYDDFDCTCGAWRWSKNLGKPIHVADCICGSSEPW